MGFIHWFDPLLPLLALATLACCGAPTAPGGGNHGCNSVCPIGCDISVDCSRCTPESPTAGLGTACQTDNDCCTGNCLQGICTGISLGQSDAGTAQTKPTGSSSATTSGGQASGGGSGGSPSSCPPSSTTSFQDDEACGNIQRLVCSPQGSCIPNCNSQAASFCTGGTSCLANGHCGSNAPPSATTGGSSGSSSAGTSAGASSGGTSSGSSGGYTSAGSTGGSTGTGSLGGTTGTSGGSTGGAADYCATCQTDSDCGGGANLCLQATSGAPFCGTDCSAGQSCPSGASCQAITDSTGSPAGSQCVP
ncbi:MAG: hypothetical protein ACYCWW_06090, partial [Deltaproteobacteria bacterium]